jgi:[acyl-carrier-protein] S-malonyltransferase
MDARGATSTTAVPAAGPLLAGPAATGVALLFPGQGSQTDDMRELVAGHRPDLLDAAIEGCGSDPFERLEEGTDFAQPAMYAASMAAWERAGRPDAVAMAGHSLGELAALAAAGAIDGVSGLRVAVARGRLMRRAAEQGPPGGMIAVLGDEEETERLAAEVGLAVANRNTRGQLVLSGPVPGVDAVADAARGRGLKAMRLPINGAFHSAAMAAAVPEFFEIADGAGFREPEVPVYSSVTARPFGDIPRTLASALVNPVRWTDTLNALSESGVERFVEPGPGRVLTGLVKRTLPDAEAVALEARDG